MRLSLNLQVVLAILVHKKIRYCKSITSGFVSSVSALFFKKLQTEQRRQLCDQIIEKYASLLCKFVIC